MSETIQHYDIDKRALWGDGPWVGEPDLVHWVDAHTGLHCMAVRNQVLGNWCGYVAIPAYHRFYGYNHVIISERGIRPHGGVTFTASGTPADLASGVTFTASGTPADLAPGEFTPGELFWWVGFDCSHLNDLTPKFQKLVVNKFLNAVYRPLSYVRDVVTTLAAELFKQHTPLDHLARGS